MNHPRALATLSGLTLVAMSVLAFGGGSAKAGAELVRYASPGGSGFTCIQSAPCSLEIAVDNAEAGSKILVMPGSYGPIPDELDNSGADLQIHGITGEATPVITLSNSHEGIYLTGNTTLSHVDIDYIGTGSGLFVYGGTVNHVAVLATADDTDACDVYGTLTDSLCIDTGTDGEAFNNAEGGAAPPIATPTSTIRGSTLVAPNAGDALYVDAGAYTTITVNATNDIVQGGAEDIVANTDEPTATSNVNLDHSDYATAKAVHTGPAGNATIHDGTGDIHAAPIFRNPALLKFQEKATSPTINKGALDPAKSTDLAGFSRKLGGTPDMGAYEFLEKPVVKKLKATSKTPHSAHLAVPINPEGLATSVAFVAHQGKAKATGKASAGHSTLLTPVRITLTKLKAHTRYAVTVTATNLAGKAQSNTVHFRTPKVSPKHNKPQHTRLRSG